MAVRRAGEAAAREREPGAGRYPGAASSIGRETRLAATVAEVPVEDLRYKMIMALNAADIGNPICEQAAEICAEIADKHCAQLHVTTTAHLVAAGQSAANGPAPARA
jgi:hypothetical protein